MGRIRGKDVKGIAFKLFEAYPGRFGKEFSRNKKALEELQILEGKSKRYCNRVAGYIVRIARVSERKPAGEERAEEGAFDEGDSGSR